MPRPIQPMELDESGTLRFKENKIVRALLDTHPKMDMIMIATLPFSVEDQRQFNQLIGCSVDRYCEKQINCEDEAHLAEIEKLEQQTLAALRLIADNT